MRKLAAALALAVALALPASVAGFSRPVGVTGIAGQVLAFPNAVPCAFYVPCASPVAASVNVWHAGVRVRTVTSDATGRFRVALPAGIYTLRHRAADGSVDSLRVIVRRPSMTQVEFLISSGL